MEREGPILESLTRRLAETPPDFLSEPRIGKSGRTHVDGVVCDLLRLVGADVDLDGLDRFVGSDVRSDRNRLAVVLILCWLLSDDWFRRTRPNADSLIELLDSEARALAEQVAAQKFVLDPDRREELARLRLARLGFRPGGESISQAQDRLATLNSAERARVIKAAQIAEQRARKIREELARKAAEESADKWTRE